MQTVAVTPVLFARVIVNDGGAQSELNVRVLWFIFGRNKALRFRDTGGDPASAFGAPLKDGFDHVNRTLERKPHGFVDFARAVDQGCGQVVLQILPHTGQLMQQLNAHRFEMPCWAYARQQQQLG